MWLKTEAGEPGWFLGHDEREPEGEYRGRGHGCVGPYVESVRAHVKDADEMTAVAAGPLMAFYLDHGR